MKRDELLKLVIQFKKSLGYIDRPTDNPNAMLFTKGEIEELVYIHGPGEENILSESLSELSQKYRRIPETFRIFLTTTPLGRPPEYVSQNGFKYQVPIWFFDREFSLFKKSTPLKVLEANIEKYERERISQPFICDGREGDDLLFTLLQELDSSNQDTSQQGLIRIIFAPAGFGKTVLMASLYSELSKRFNESKKRQQMARRPLIMLPGHIAKASDLDGLISNFINSEYTFGDASIETFKFWVNNNFVIWLLDGVEELFIKNPEECLHSLLEDYLLAPDAKEPQIIIALRKTLLATSPEIKNYLEEWEECIKVYELREWRKKEKISYFNKNLSLSQQEKDNFMVDVEASPVLNKLCSVPYFCSLIADLKNNNELRAFNDECELMEYTFRKYCEREFHKGLDRDIFSIDIQQEIFVDLAGESLKRGEISKESITDWVRICTENLSENNQEQQINCFLQHALLTQIENKIVFTHEIIREFLEAIYLLEKVKPDKIDIFNSIKEIEYGSFLLNYLIKKLPSDINWDEIINNANQMPCSPKEEAIGFRNILKIITESNYPGIENIIKDYLSVKNLKGIRFKNLNMIGFNFQNSNLELASFENCELENANFDGCVFKETEFKNCNLKSATFKGAYFYSIKIDEKYINDVKEIKRKLYEIAGESIIESQNEPCQALINLLEILKKLAVKPRGYEMPKKFLTQMRLRIVPAHKIVEELIKEKIFLEEREKIRINPRLYETIRIFTYYPSTELSEIRNILDRICRDVSTGCNHFRKVPS